MSSIGILTYFNYYNYGSMLQGYATQVALRKYLNSNDSCLLINYRYASSISLSKKSLFYLRLKRLFYYVANLKMIIVRFRYSSRLSQKNRLFDNFRDYFIDTTNDFYRNKEELISNPPQFDTYVVGSDQTWSPKVSGGYSETPMFFDYIPTGFYKCAYAPSLGTCNLSESDINYLKSQVTQFEILSCRENDGTNLIKTLTSKNVDKVLDPTLLLCAQEWRKVSITPSLQTNGYILCYFIGDRDYYRNFAKQIGKQLQLPIYYIPVSWKDCKSSNNLLFDVGPREFIGLIDNAKVVLTDSFHGTAFCTNLNSNFYSFIKHSGGKSSEDNSRLFDFLSGLNLGHRLIEDYNNDIIEFSEIDFSSVNKIIATQRRQSYNVIQSIANISHSK